MTAIVAARALAPPAPAAPAARAGGAGDARLLDRWVAIQALNLDRHARSLRPFRKDEFGTGPQAPSEAHVGAANRFVDRFKRDLVERTRWVEAAAAAARREPTSARLRVLLERKEAVANRVLYVEGLWDFFFDLFVQRLSAFGERLRAVDRIGANCYEDLYVGMGTAKPTPALLPFSYAASGFSPATFRRGVPIARLRKNPNPFPLVMLPQHRLENVWAMSSVLHEVSHNLQADLGLWNAIPERIFARLTGEAKLPEPVARVWARWHKETTADVLALLFGGPAAIESLMDVVGRSPASTYAFSPLSVHPTPYLRVPLNLVLLERLGFAKLAGDLNKVWERLYPSVPPSGIPPAMTSSFPTAARLAIDTIAFQPYPQLGGKSLAQILVFGPPQQATIAETARRLAAGEDAGTVPPRFLIGAARHAIDRRLATPQTITDTFYRTLGRR
jgi:hypothetical protein